MSGASAARAVAGPAALARALGRARRDGEVVPRAVLEAVKDPAEAYAVQDAVLQDMGGIGAWKIGGTGAASLQVLGLPGPFFAPVPAGAIHADGAEVAVPAAHRPLVEVEFALRLGARLPAGRGDYRLDEVRAAVAGVHPALEIVGCRVEGGVAGLGVGAIADGGVNGAVVLGAALPRAANLRRPVTLSLGGVQKAAGSMRDLAWKDLFDALLWLANHPERRRDLEAGQYVLTGTCTGVCPLEPGDAPVGGFGDLARVSCRIARG